MRLPSAYRLISAYGTQRDAEIVMGRDRSLLGVIGEMALKRLHLSYAAIRSARRRRDAELGLGVDGPQPRESRCCVSPCVPRAMRVRSSRSGGARVLCAVVAALRQHAGGLQRLGLSPRRPGEQ